MHGHVQQNGSPGKIAVLAVLLLAPLSAHASLVNMTAYILSPLYQQDGVTPLPDGAIVQIIGSTDGILDPPATWGGTNLTGQTTGDDIILATIVIDSTILGIPGTFYVSGIYYDNTVVNYAYLRFYNATSGPAGLVWWGETPITNIEYDAFGAIFVDFIGGYSTTNQNNFVVIPEPNTVNYLLLWLAMIGAIRSATRSRVRSCRADGAGNSRALEQRLLSKKNGRD